MLSPPAAYTLTNLGEFIFSLYVWPQLARTVKLKITELTRWATDSIHGNGVNQTSIQGSILVHKLPPRPHTKKTAINAGSRAGSQSTNLPSASHDCIKSPSVMLSRQNNVLLSFRVHHYIFRRSPAESISSLRQPYRSQIPWQTRYKIMDPSYKCSEKTKW